MLFVALTQSSILHRLPGGLARESRVSLNWLLSWVTDDFVSQWSMAEGETAVWESLLGHPNNRRDGVSFVEARFSPAQQVLRVIKSSVSGRPVYYSVNSRNEFFLSTHIALLRQAGVPIEDDPEALPELLVYRTMAPPRTLYRGIRQMGMAGSMVVQLKAGNLQVSDVSDGYHPSESTYMGSEGEAVDRVVDTLTRAVDKLAAVAPRVATLLSGGVDSSILSVIARDRLSTSDTSSTSYPHDDFETNFEQTYALSAAQALGTRHTLFAPAATDFLTGFIEALAAAEAPLNHLQSILLYLLFKHASPDGSDRIICGEGADSVFGLETHFALRQPPSLGRRFWPFRPCIWDCAQWVPAGPEPRRWPRTSRRSGDCACPSQTLPTQYGATLRTEISDGSRITTGLLVRTSLRPAASNSSPWQTDPSMMCWQFTLSVTATWQSRPRYGRSWRKDNEKSFTSHSPVRTFWTAHFPSRGRSS